VTEDPEIERFLNAYPAFRGVRLAPAGEYAAGDESTMATWFGIWKRAKLDAEGKKPPEGL
jgi:hypothetical protein